jgi:hypothetical protein
MAGDALRMPELLVIVPSRGRPGNVGRLLGAVAATMDGHAQVLVAIDNDDPTQPAYLEAAAEVGFAWLEAGPHLGLGPTLNSYARRYAGQYQAIGFMGDDHLPRTAAWDTLVLAALAELGPAGMCYGDDRLQGPNLPTAVFVGSCLIEGLGWLVPPTLRHLYVDNYWLALGRRLGTIRYLPGVVVEHLHPAARKAPWDAGYQEVNSADAYARDGAAWQAWALNHLADDAARVRRHCLQAGP